MTGDEIGTTHDMVWVSGALDRTYFLGDGMFWRTTRERCSATGSGRVCCRFVEEGLIWKHPVVGDRIS